MVPGTRHRVAVIGTFDVENFGDLLFPIIAERELAERIEGCEVVVLVPSARPAVVAVSGQVVDATRGRSRID